MNLHNILTAIEKKDPEVLEKMGSRRAAIKKFTNASGKIALAAIPLAFAGMFKSAYGQSAPSDIKGVLNFALTLEYLEAEFYTKGAASGVVPAGTPAVGAINTIRDHENAHVAFLKSVLKDDAVAKPDFDFTAGGHFPNPFANYDVFLAVAQTFEDTGVRAYKGQAGKLMSDNTVLTAALQIHSVEARHASHIRQMRQARNAGMVIKPWITGKDPGGINDAVVQKSYNGEEVSTQAGVDIKTFVSDTAATESFDEPLTYEQVIEIVTPFIKS